MFVRNQMPEPIRGVLAPVVTPFKADLSPDRQRFIRHCQWLVSHNCGLAVFGTNSEANSMSAEERMALLDALVAAGIDPSRMMPGTGCCSITETVELTAHAVKHGCAGGDRRYHTQNGRAPSDGLSNRDRRDERQLGRLEQHQNFSRRVCGTNRPCGSHLRCVCGQRIVPARQYAQRR